MRHRLLAAVLALTMSAVACSESSLELSSSDEVEAPDEGRLDDRVLTDPDDVVAVALEDVIAFWDETMPELYDVELAPLEGGLIAYGPRTEVPQCGPEPLSYRDVAENAFYCPAEDYIAWDRVNLIPQLQQDFGRLTTGIVMAHEFGHAIQARARTEAPTVVLELQADCFAGAWLADADDRIATFAAEDTDLDEAIAGLLELRDALGVTGSDPQAHGSGFDRVSAFQDGFEGGAEVCAAYEDDAPEVVAIPFGSAADARTGGNLPLEQLIEPLVADLESFFSSLFVDEGHRWTPVGEIVPVDPAADVVECGGDTIEGADLEFASFYCVDDNRVYLDGSGLVPRLAEIGDFAFGGELARLYAFSAQAQLGYVENTRGTDLHADCLTGVYAAAEFLQVIPDQQLELSPGDLDEIVVAFLAFGSHGTATAFERTAAFRAGFVSGFGACADFLDD